MVSNQISLLKNSKITTDDIGINDGYTYFCYVPYVTITQKDANGNHTIVTYYDENKDADLPLEDINIHELTRSISPHIYYENSSLEFEDAAGYYITFKWRLEYHHSSISDSYAFSNLSYYSSFGATNIDDTYKIEFVNSADQSESDVTYYDEVSTSASYRYSYNIATNIGLTNHGLLPRLSLADGSYSALNTRVSNLYVQFNTVDNIGTVYDLGKFWRVNFTNSHFFYNETSATLSYSSTDCWFPSSYTFVISKEPIDLSGYPGYPSNWSLGDFIINSDYYYNSLNSCKLYSYPYPVNGLSGSSFTIANSDGSYYLADKDQSSKYPSSTWVEEDSSGNPLDFNTLRSISNYWYPSIEIRGYNYVTMPRASAMIKSVASPFKVNIGGSWKDTISSYVNVNGSWKKITKSYTKVNGLWKECK